VRRRQFVFGAAATLAAVVSPGRAGAAEATRFVIGRSVRDRSIVAHRLGPVDAAEIYLVLGQMHGDERAGVDVARRHLLHLAAPRGVQLWVIPTMNPDGHADDRRTNARGVDLNRNFPSRDWVRQNFGTRYYSGPEPMSEPESLAVKRFLDDLAPRTVISVHQPLACVDYSGGQPSVTDWLARELELPARTLGASGGNLTTWFNDKYDRKTATTLELPPSPTDQYRERVAHTLVRHAAHRRG